MPTYVFKCEGCGAYRPFLIHEGEMPEPERKDPVQKHCAKCRTITNWIFAFPDRRANGARRGKADRRTREKRCLFASKSSFSCITLGLMAVCVHPRQPT